MRTCQKEPREIGLEVDRMGLNPSRSLGLSELHFAHLEEGKYSLPPSTGVVNETLMTKCSGHTGVCLAQIKEHRDVSVSELSHSCPAAQSVI